MTAGELDGHVHAIFRTLDPLPPAAIHTLAAALDLAEEPAAWLSAPVRYYARGREDGEREPSPLAPITMRSALHNATAEGTLLLCLSHAETPFWREVETALVTLSADRLPAEA